MNENNQPQSQQTIHDCYEITESGKIYSIESNWRGYGKREMISIPDESGHMRVRLTVNGIRRRYFVHRLVIEKFKGPKPSPMHQVRHLDGNKLNNHINNLKWGTAKENAEDRDLHVGTSKGKRHSEFIKAGIYANRK